MSNKGWNMHGRCMEEGKELDKLTLHLPLRDPPWLNDKASLRRCEAPSALPYFDVLAIAFFREKCLQRSMCLS